MISHLINNNAFDGVSYGFLARDGGVSSGIYKGLNCGPGSNDAPENIETNRKTASELVSGSKSTPLVSCYQVHGNNVCEVIDDWGNNRPKADGMVTRKHGIILGILTADCTPVLFADPKAAVIGAAHAGWKGALCGILENTIAKMEQLGANRENITAMIGPTIQQNSYEVSAAFRDNFLSHEVTYEQFFAAGNNPGHCQFNLPAFVAYRLENAQVASVANAGIDTYRSEAHFSYRRTTHRHEPDYGRQLSGIMLAP
ncbi:peptidoglycan editing factor PgeF [Kordiimonas aquimaris]|uniref:peptidoglycan editing factor PgeF n=1 Tax=Kordiimonas aquimaris TaxID=707591 RepID=UPI0021D19A5B|nr:peptidoglycan editing factor PgeF [Kordiimonas aquimaris]